MIWQISEKVAPGSSRNPFQSQSGARRPENPLNLAAGNSFRFAKLQGNP